MPNAHTSICTFPVSFGPAHVFTTRSSMTCESSSHTMPFRPSITLFA